MTSTDLDGFRKSLIEAILGDKDRNELVVDTINGKLDMNSKQTFRSLCQAKMKAESDADAEAIANGTKPLMFDCDCIHGKHSGLSKKKRRLVSNAAFFSYGDRSAAYFKYEEMRVLYKIPGEKKVATPEKLKKSKGSPIPLSSEWYSMKFAGLSFQSDSKKPAENKKRNTEKKTGSPDA